MQNSLASQFLASQFQNVHSLIVSKSSVRCTKVVNIFGPRRARRMLHRLRRYIVDGMLHKISVCIVSIFYF